MQKNFELFLFLFYVFLNAPSRTRVQMIKLNKKGNDKFGSKNLLVYHSFVIITLTYVSLVTYFYTVYEKQQVTTSEQHKQNM